MKDNFNSSHEHEAHSSHGDSCSCGHNHEHDGHHSHEDSCSCGHNHEHDGHHTKHIYLLENLGCAHCAAKMEEQIQALPGVQSASITYATKQLRLCADDPQMLLPQIQRICASIESQVKVIPRTEKVPGNMQTKTYILEHLGCAHCAAKMEEQIGRLDGVSDAVITFATKQLRITAQNPDRYLPDIRRICTSIESGVMVTEKKPAKEAVQPEKETGKTAQNPSGKQHSSENRDLICILIGALFFIFGTVLEHMHFNSTLTFLLFLTAYLILGGEILLEAARNISHGQIFDENFLMCIATIGAFAIREYPEAVGVMLFYRIGEFFEHKAVERSRGQIMDALDMRPEVVNLLVDEDVQVIPAEDARIGDLLLIRPGDRIPLDGVIVEGDSRLDTSPITGEPVPAAAGCGDEVISGCVNLSGQLKIRVEKTLSDSMVTRILDSVENAAASKPKIDRFITRFAKVYTPCVVFGALAVAVIPSLFTGAWHYWTYTALTFLVMSCPCALVLSVPLAFFSGIGAGSKKGILFKGGVSMEALGRLGAVVMDKTGTITKGNFELQRIIPAGSWNEEDLLRICAGCEQHSTHPIAHSIVEAAQKKQLTLETPSSLEEIAGHGIKAELMQNTVLCGNLKLMEKYHVSVPDNHDTAFGAEVFVAVNGDFAGCLVISDTIKDDALAAVKRLRAMGLHTVMLTGDSENSANAVAKAVGIDEVHAKLLPQDKLNLLADIRSSHGSVMFVGDGINDAPVLAGADVGAAMGSGADAAIEAADAVFMNSCLSSVPDSVAIARSTNRIAMQNVVFALVIKIAVMILGLCGFANMWMAVFADTGVAMICILNSIRALYKYK